MKDYDADCPICHGNHYSDEHDAVMAGAPVRPPRTTTCGHSDCRVPEHYLIAALDSQTVLRLLDQLDVYCVALKQVMLDLALIAPDDDYKVLRSWTNALAALPEKEDTWLRPALAALDVKEPQKADSTYRVIGSLYAHECAHRCDSAYAVNCNCNGDCEKHASSEGARK